jgi:hypothetical protein
MSGTVAEVDQIIGQNESLEPVGQRGDKRQTCSGHRPVVVEGHCKARRTVRFCVHRKDAFLCWWLWTSASHILPTQGAFSAYGQTSAGEVGGGISVDPG